MLPAGNRLRRREEFATAVRRGRRAGRPLLVTHLYTAPPADAAGDRAPDDLHPYAVEDPVSLPRAGFVVSRAVGGATVRNTVKRRLRHLVRERIAQLPAGSLLVVRALPPAAEASSAALGADLDTTLRRLLGPRREVSKQ